MFSHLHHASPKTPTQHILSILWANSMYYLHTYTPPPSSCPSLFLTGSPGKIEGFTPFLSEPDEDLLEIAEKMAMPKVVAHPFDIPYPLNQLLLLFFPSNFNIFYNTFIILTVQRETHFRSDGGLFVPLGRYHTHPYAPLSSQTSIYQ